MTKRLRDVSIQTLPSLGIATANADVLVSINEHCPMKHYLLDMEGYLSKKSIHINESFVHALALTLW